MAKKKRSKKKSPTIKTGRPTPSKLKLDKDIKFTRNGFIDTETSSLTDDARVRIFGDWHGTTLASIPTATVTSSPRAWVTSVSPSVDGLSRDVTVSMMTDEFVGQIDNDITRASFTNSVHQTVNGFLGTGDIRIHDNVQITIDSPFTTSAGAVSATASHYEHRWNIDTASAAEVTVRYIGDSIGEWQADPKEIIKREIKRHMRSNLLIKSGRSRSISRHLSPAEEKARKTLRDHITERAYRRYMTNGFIMVKGQSGLHYQVFSDRRHTMIYHNNKIAGEICINTDHACPPTDHVINIKTMLEIDEISVWHGGNLKKFAEGFQIPFELSKKPSSYRSISQPTDKKEVQSISLLEAYKAAKLKAA